MAQRPSRRIVAVLSISIVAFGLIGGSAGAATPKLQRMLDGIVASAEGPPGISVLIDSGKRKRFFRAGVADLSNRRRPQPDEHVRIASVAKGFNAFIAATLAARPKSLSLRETLGASIPGVLPSAERVTLTQLLQHTSGLPDYIRAPAFVETFLADPAAYLSPTQLTDFVRDEPLEFRPGSRYHYSDTDNIAAALMEEVAAGRTYTSLLRSEVFRPFGMRSSSLPETIKMPRPFMHGYEIEQGKKPADVSELINPAGAWASGGIVSTPADLSRFVPAYVPTILRASRSLAKAFRPGKSSPPGPGKNFAGLGIFRYRTRCGDIYGHTGSFPGYRLFVAGSAKGGRSVVFVVNSQIVPGQGSQRVAAAIRRAQARAVCRALR
ncbi:MAG: serine hydrolase domain-containing protein [Solirubrobacterales bacterium]